MPYKRKKKKHALLRRWQRQHMQQLAEQAAVAVIARVNRGEGSDDKPLERHSSLSSKPSYKSGAYSKSHGRLRDLGGKYRKNVKIGGKLPVNRVTLSVTGRMLQQFRLIKSSVRRYSANIGPTGASRKYAPHVDALRPWMKLSDKDKDAVVKVFRTIWRGMK